MKIGYRDVWKLKAYRWNLIAGMIGRLGDSIDMIGFSWMMYGLTKSTLYTAIVFGVNMLPTIILQPFAGAMIERISKKKIIVLCDSARFVLTTFILFLYMCDMLNPVFLLFVTFLNNLFEAFRMPAGTCFLADTLPQDMYEQGVSLNQSTSRTCELIGTGLAGVIIAGVGVKGTLFCDLLAFLICALMISRIHLTESNVADNVPIKQHIKSTMIQMKEGLHYMMRKRVVLIIAITASLLNVGLVPLNSFEAAYVQGALNGSAILLSGLSVSISCGGIIGAFLYPYLHEKISNKWMLLSIGVILGGYNIILAALPYVENRMWIWIGLLGSSFLLGITAGCGNVLASSSFMMHVEKEYLARASAIFSAVACAFMPVVSFVVGAISKITDILPIFFVFGIIFILLFIYMFRIKKMDEI